MEQSLYRAKVVLQSQKDKKAIRVQNESSRTTRKTQSTTESSNKKDNTKEKNNNENNIESKLAKSKILRIKILFLMKNMILKDKKF